MVTMNEKVIKPQIQKDNDMCEANAYLIDGEETLLIMEAVDVVEPEDDGVRLISIFGDQKYLKARIYSLSLVDHKIFLK
jgi:predicted RNA-binding protein